jgi:hypothetical protein
MEANVDVGLSSNELAAIFGPDKYKEELWPLISPVVKRVSAHPRLRDEINKLFNNIELQEINEDARNGFKTALKALQDKVMEIKTRNAKVPNELEKLREKQAIFPEMAQGGRRRTKKAYFYNKRRKTRRRKGKK